MTLRASATTAQYLFGDDTTTVATPVPFSVALSPDAHQPEYQDTASFVIRGPESEVCFEITSSHFSSGNRDANMGKFKSIILSKQANSSHPQVAMGDINTEVKSAEALQALADETRMVAIVPSLKIRKLRGLQDQLHKRMDQKDDYDSMFMAVDPGLVDREKLMAVEDQNMAWPQQPALGIWKPTRPQDVAQAWKDERILTDHGVLKCPLIGGAVLGLCNAARANYDKYNIKNEAQIDRRPYLEGQQIIETCVADVVIEFVGSLASSSTLPREAQAATVRALEEYRSGIDERYQIAYTAWADEDDLCSDQTPLGQALKALGEHSRRFVSITRALSWEDIRDAPEARTALKASLTAMLVEKLGVGSSDPSLPLSNREAYREPEFREKCEKKISAAWERIIKRCAAGDLYKLWFAELLQGQTTGGMPIPGPVLREPTEDYIARRRQELGLGETICVTVEALR